MDEIEQKNLEQKLNLAEDCGLNYTDEVDENGEPIFIGSKSAFSKYEKEKDSLLLMES